MLISFHQMPLGKKFREELALTDDSGFEPGALRLFQTKEP